MAEKFLEPRARFQKTVVAGEIDAVVPLQAVGEGLPADVARPDKARTVQVSIL